MRGRIAMCRLHFFGRLEGEQPLKIAVERDGDSAEDVR
jgi:hypothetical protein